MTMSFDDACYALWLGRVRFDAFARATAPRWGALAARLQRHWKMPPWFSHEDLVQELLVGCWRGMQKYDPEKPEHGYTPRAVGKYAVWCGMDRAKKRGHKARGANLHRRADSCPSRFERAFSTIGDPSPDDRDFEDRVQALMATEPVQLELLVQRAERKEAVARAAESCENLHDAFLVQAVGEAGSIEDVAALLYGDPDVLFQNEWRTPGAVVRRVKEAAERAAERVAAA